MSRLVFRLFWWIKCRSWHSPFTSSDGDGGTVRMSSLCEKVWMNPKAAHGNPGRLRMLVSGWACYICMCDHFSRGWRTWGKGCSGIAGGKGWKKANSACCAVHSLGWYSPQMIQNWNEWERGVCTGEAVESESHYYMSIGESYSHQLGDGRAAMVCE